MARPQKATVDYFPLDCQFGDSIKAIENLYGNNGFVVWVKLLQKLGRTENHVIDVNTDVQWSLFYSNFKVPETELLDIINMLAQLNCIDSELWKHKIIYSKNFVDRISDAYRNRKNDILTYEQIYSKFVRNPVSDVRNSITDVRNSISDVRNTQTKLNKNNIIDIKQTKKFTRPTVEEIKSYCIERKNNVDAQYFYDYYSSKGWVVGKSPMKDWKATIRTWERNDFNNKTNKQEESKENYVWNPNL